MTSVEGARLDLTLRAFAFQRGDITGIGTWLLWDGEYHPGMVLVRTGEELAEATRPYFISMDHAWIFDENVGSTTEAAEHVTNIIRHLRLAEHDERTVFKVFAFINDHLGDMLSMTRSPPPRDPGRVIAEVTLTDTNTGATHEVEVRDV